MPETKLRTEGGGAPLSLFRAAISSLWGGTSDGSPPNICADGGDNSTLKPASA
jgi:hypothetical protein